MTQINHKALRAEILTPGVASIATLRKLALSLLDELDASDRRLMDLEMRLEKAAKLQDSAFRHGLQHGFSYGQTNDQEGYAQCLSAYGAAAAGIKLNTEGE